MSTTITTQRVKDYGIWKKEFERFKNVRDEYGAAFEHMYRDADDPNRITVILKWKSLSNARKFYSSPELKDALKRGGIDGKQSISYLDEA